MNNADKLLKIGMELGRIQTQFEDLKEENTQLQDKIKELEEENKTLKELNVCVGCNNNPDYKTRIDKAIEYILNTDLATLDKWKVQEILKGEENEDNFKYNGNVDGYRFSFKDFG